MPYKINNEEYFPIKEIVSTRGQKITARNIVSTQKFMNKKKVSFINHPITKSRLYKREEIEAVLPSFKDGIELIELELQNEFVEGIIDEEENIVNENDFENQKINVIYTRVPKNSPNCMEFLRKQQENLLQYCVANGIKIDKKYNDVCFGHKFNKYERPGLFSLMNDIKNGKISRIYIMSPDVISQYFFEFFVNYCQMYNVHAECITSEPIPEIKEYFMDEITDMMNTIRKRYENC